MLSASHFDQVLGQLSPDLDFDALAFATKAIERRRVVAPGAAVVLATILGQTTPPDLRAAAEAAHQRLAHPRRK